MSASLEFLCVPGVFGRGRRLVSCSSARTHAHGSNPCVCQLNSLLRGLRWLAHVLLFSVLPVLASNRLKRLTVEFLKKK